MGKPAGLEIRRRGARGNHLLGNENGFKITYVHIHLEKVMMITKSVQEFPSPTLFSNYCDLLVPFRL